MQKTIIIQAFMFFVFHAGSALAQQNLDNSARTLGFKNYQHYQTARGVCFELLNRNPLTTLNCGSDMRCLQQEGVVIQQKYKALTQSGAWISNNCTVVMQVEQKASQAARSGGSNVYMVESDHNDEIFMINGEKFEAQSYCMDLYEGDEVVFIEGSPFGACTSATVVNLRTKNRCDLWCE